MKPISILFFWGLALHDEVSGPPGIVRQRSRIAEDFAAGVEKELAKYKNAAGEAKEEKKEEKPEEKEEKKEAFPNVRTPEGPGT